MSNLNALSTRLNTTNFTNTTLTASTTDSTITSTYTTDAGIYDNFGTDAGALKSTLESSAASQDDADMGQGLFDLLDTLYGLFAIPTFYDGNLNSIVIYGDMYNSDAHVSPEYTIIQSMFGTIAAAKDFVLSLASLDIIGALIAVADFIRCLADFIVGMIDYQLTSIRMIVSLFDDANGRSFGERLYNQFLISGYSAYNFPNRTNYGKFK